jgi:hypothetical protein
MDTKSYVKKYRRQLDDDTQVTFPLYTAVVTVDEGVVTGVVWDDGCHFCADSSCEYNTYNFAGEVVSDHVGKDCYVADDSCKNTAGEVSELCELNVYVVWSGTDSTGNYFRSAEKRFSRFRGMSVDNYIESAAETYEDAQDTDIAVRRQMSIPVTANSL